MAYTNPPLCKIAFQDFLNFIFHSLNGQKISTPPTRRFTYINHLRRNYNFGVSDYPLNTLFITILSHDRDWHNKTDHQQHAFHGLFSTFTFLILPGSHLSIVILSIWFKRQLLFRHRLDFLSAVEQRKIFSFGPQRQQVVVMSAPRLSRLPWNVRGHRPIPIAHVQNFAERRAVALLEVRPAGTVHRVRVAAALDRRQIEERQAFGVRRKSVREWRDVQFAPTPLRRIIAEPFARLFHGVF